MEVAQLARGEGSWTQTSQKQQNYANRYLIIQITTRLVFVHYFRIVYFCTETPPLPWNFLVLCVISQNAQACVCHVVFHAYILWAWRIKTYNSEHIFDGIEQFFLWNCDFRESIIHLNSNLLHFSCKNEGDNYCTLTISFLYNNVVNILQHSEPKPLLPE